jgi:hypothetical protein
MTSAKQRWLFEFGVFIVFIVFIVFVDTVLLDDLIRSQDMMPE